MFLDFLDFVWFIWMLFFFCFFWFLVFLTCFELFSTNLQLLVLCKPSSQNPTMINGYINVYALTSISQTCLSEKQKMAHSEKMNVLYMRGWFYTQINEENAILLRNVHCVWWISAFGWLWLIFRYFRKNGWNQK